MNRHWLQLASALLLPAACAASPDPASDESNVTSRAITDVSYSDLGTQIYVSGSAAFFEGSANLFLRNESDPTYNAKLPAAGNQLGVSATTVAGENGVHGFRRVAFDVQVLKDGALAGLKVGNGECIGVYESNGGDKPVTVGAFLSCDPPASGEIPFCQKTLYRDAAACLADQARLISVAYGDLGNDVVVKTNVAFWEGTAFVSLRNETNPAANVDGRIGGTALEGANGLREVDAHISLGDTGAATVPKLGDCIGLYMATGAGDFDIGAFKYYPDDLSGRTERKPEYFFSVKRCLGK